MWHRTQIRQNLWPSGQKMFEFELIISEQSLPDWIKLFLIWAFIFICILNRKKSKRE